MPVDQVNAIRPAGVGSFRAVAEFVEHGGKLDPKLAHAGAGNECPVLFVLRAGEYDLVVNVALHLPNIAGMRLQNVDDEEGHLAAVLIVKSVESGNLPPEGRSRVAAEDEHHGLAGCQRR